ncbi:MAG: MocR-like transcription factor YczR [Acidimicrobiales bacterium]
MALRALVLDARIPIGARLPAERPLAQALRLSRTTVTAAYQVLREEGFVHSRQGGGTWTALPPGRHRRGAPWAPAVPEEADWLDLSLAAPEGDDEILVAVTEATSLLRSHLGGHGYEPGGLGVLREAVARRYEARGLPTTADQVMITNGAQQGIDLVVRALVDPLDPVVVECPTYPNALDVFARARARVVTVGMYELGWEPDLVISALRQVLPRLAYLMPDFHNPTGLLMPGSCRAAIAEAAAGSGTCVVVDETFAELALDEVDVPAPFACHDDGRVVSVSSMSKAYWAGLRIGWVRANPALLRRLREARGCVDMASPILEQLVAAWLLDHGRDLLNRRRGILASRRDALVRGLTNQLGDWRFQVPAGGLSLWVDLAAPISTALVQGAEAHRLRLAAGRRFGPEGTLERYLRLPYTLPEDDLADAVNRLVAVRADLDAGWLPAPHRAPVA